MDKKKLGNLRLERSILYEQIIELRQKTSEVMAEFDEYKHVSFDHKVASFNLMLQDQLIGEHKLSQNLQDESLIWLEELSKSSTKLEKLTWGLITISVALTALTIVLAYGTFP